MRHTLSLGDDEGTMEGLSVAIVGDCVGPPVGFEVGEVVGPAVGADVG